MNLTVSLLFKYKLKPLIYWLSYKYLNSSKFYSSFSIKSQILFCKFFVQAKHVSYLVSQFSKLSIIITFKSTHQYIFYEQFIQQIFVMYEDHIVFFFFFFFFFLRVLRLYAWSYCIHITTNYGKSGLKHYVNTLPALNLVGSSSFKFMCRY